MIRITALWLISAGAAFAEVCDKERPGWDGTPVGPLAEAVHLLTNPVMLALIGAGIVATLLKLRIIRVILAAMIGGIAYLIWDESLNDPTGITAAAGAEGCQGSPWLAAMLLALLAISILNGRIPRPL